MDKDSLGTAAYFEVRWPNYDQWGQPQGSGSERFECSEFPQAQACLADQVAAGKEAILVSVATVQLL